MAVRLSASPGCCRAASFVRVESRRVVDGKESSECRHYISSLPSTSADEIVRAVREHWGVENGLH